MVNDKVNPITDVHDMDLITGNLLDGLLIILASKEQDAPIEEAVRTSLWVSWAS